MTRRVLLLTLALATAVAAQPVSRRATNLGALATYPAFFHGRPIVIVGTVSLRDDGQYRVMDEAGSMSMRLIVKGSAPDGLDEIRGEFWDLARMKSDEPKLAGIDLKKVFDIEPGSSWPRSGEVTAIMATAVTAATPPVAPSIRAIVLHPTRYLDQKVTVIGQFSGRNLFGDQPDAPAKSRYDFVLKTSDASIWIVGARPKGKNFNLSVDARIDTGRWLEVSGVLKGGRGLEWLDVPADSIQLAKPPTETTEVEAPIRTPAGPPPEVVFSAPTMDEIDVSLSSAVRIQFSRDLDQSTIKGHIRASYLESQTVERGEPTTPAAEFTTQYIGANRVVEIRFLKPLERFRTMKVELLEGILGTDHQPLKPWTLTFSIGGS